MNPDFFEVGDGASQFVTAELMRFFGWFFGALRFAQFVYEASEGLYLIARAHSRPSVANEHRNWDACRLVLLKNALIDLEPISRKFRVDLLAPGVDSTAQAEALLQAVAPEPCDAVEDINAAVVVEKQAGV